MIKINKDRIPLGFSRMGVSQAYASPAFHQWNSSLAWVTAFNTEAAWPFTPWPVCWGCYQGDQSALTVVVIIVALLFSPLPPQLWCASGICRLWWSGPKDQLGTSPSSAWKLTAPSLAKRMLFSPLLIYHCGRPFVQECQDHIMGRRDKTCREYSFII